MWEPQDGKIRKTKLCQTLVPFTMIVKVSLTSAVEFLFKMTPFQTTSSKHLIVFLLFLLPLAENLAPIGKIREVTGVVKTVGQIPCPVTDFQDVAMILWFKDGSGAPIYSFDARTETETRRHSTLKKDNGLRLFFRVTTSGRRAPALLIRDLRSQDAGTYRCRVDYRNAPTANSMLKLRVVEPPSRIEIRDSSRFRLISDQQMVPAGGATPSDLDDISYLGPYVEGQNVTLVCISHGGTPSPKVVWYKNDLAIDSTYHFDSDDQRVVNELEIYSLGRHNSEEVYACEAWNHNDTKRISHRVNLDVYLKARHIDIQVEDHMVAGVQYHVVCKTVGAYPSVKMDVFKGKVRLSPRFQAKSDGENTTTLRVPFKPEMKDDEGYIVCRAENPWIMGDFIEAKQKLLVFYVPAVVLRFGSSKTSNFSEGESVLLECHVKANPELHSINWYQDGNPVVENREAGVIISGFTLMLMSLRFESSGRYFCEAINDIGKGQSNLVDLTVNMAPRCVEPDGGEVVITAGIGSIHKLRCDVIAWPPTGLHYFWTLSQKKNNVVPLPRRVKAANVISTTTTTPEPIIQEGPTKKVEQLQTTSAATETSIGVIDLIDVGDEDESKSLETVLETPGPTPTETTSGGGEQLFRIRRSPKYEVKGNSQYFHHAYLTFEVLTEEDFGLVACWARNSQGNQLQPCTFNIVPEVQLPKAQGDLYKNDSSLSAASTHVDEVSNRLPEEASSTTFPSFFWPSKLEETLSIWMMLMACLVFIVLLVVTAVLAWISWRRKRKLTISGMYNRRSGICSNEAEGGAATGKPDNVDQESRLNKWKQLDEGEGVNHATTYIVSCTISSRSGSNQNCNGTDSSDRRCNYQGYASSRSSARGRSEEGHEEEEQRDAEVSGGRGRSTRACSLEGREEVAPESDNEYDKFQVPAKNCSFENAEGITVSSPLLV